MTGAAIRGVHVFWIIAGFFLVTFAVNAFFITKAVATFPGEDAKKSYLQGLEYNTTLARRADQAARGWTAQVGFDPQDESQLIVRVHEPAGAPVAGLDVLARVRMAGVADEEVIEHLVEVSAGEYRTAVALSGPRREVLIEGRERGADAVVFEAHKKADAKEGDA